MAKKQMAKSLASTEHYKSAKAIGVAFIVGIALGIVLEKSIILGTTIGLVVGYLIGVSVKR